jgi:hypothetical protein
MRHAMWNTRTLVASIALVACGVVSACAGSSSSGSGTTGSADGGDSGGEDASVDAGSDGTVAPVDAGGGTDSGTTPPPDASSTAWKPVTMTCPTPGNYKTQNWSGSCGTLRWSIKTGTDSAAAGINLLPTLKTATDMVRIATPGTLPPSSRVAPAEDTVFVIENAKIQLLRLENDSDYHIVVAQGPYTFIAEVPFPGCVKAASPWHCLITRARAAIDAKYAVDANGMDPQAVATIVGVGFFDDEHGQTGAAPNNIELHAVIGFCFGQDCDPNQ